MKISGDTKKYYQQEAEKARLQMVETIKERDIVINEVSIQRIAENEVKKSINRREFELNELLSKIKGLEADYSKGLASFNETNRKRREILDGLEISIKRLEKEYGKLNLDIEKKQKTKEDLNAIDLQKKDLEQVISSLEKKKGELEESIEKKNLLLSKREEKIEREKLNLEREKLELKEKSKKLDQREKTLNDLKKELLSKK